MVLLYDYDTYGNRIRTTNASATPNRISESDYDLKLFQFIIANRQLKETGFLESTTVINYDTAFGSADQVIDPNGNSRYFDYDSLGRIITEQADTENGVETLASFEYRNSFPLSAKTTQYDGKGNSVMTRIYTDGMGRELHTIKSALDISGKRFTRSGKKVYDPVGRLIRLSQPDWGDDDEMAVYRRNNSEKHPTYFSYDASGRKKKVITPAAYVGEAETYTEFIYNDPWEITSHHSIERGKKTVKNARGQILYVTDYGTGDDHIAIEAKIGFNYDLAGNRIKKMDLNPLIVGGVTPQMELGVSELVFDSNYRDTSGYNKAYWQYDGFGRVVQNYDPDRGYAAYSYNAFGDQISFIDALNRTTTFLYDRLGRMIIKTLPGTEGVVNYIFDELVSTTNGLGRMVALDDPVQRKEFSYDQLGHRVFEKRTFKDTSRPELAKVYETTFHYDLLDRVTRINYPKDPRRDTAVKVNYIYNGMSLVDQINAETTNGTNTIISGITYNPFGQFDAVQRGNGVRTDYTYDNKRRLKRLISTRDINDFSRRLQDVEYTFDTYDNIASIINTPTEAVKNGSLGQTAMNYAYDGLNRLIDADGSYAPDELPEVLLSSLGLNTNSSSLSWAPLSLSNGRDKTPGTQINTQTFNNNGILGNTGTCTSDQCLGTLSSITKNEGNGDICDAVTCPRISGTQSFPETATNLSNSISNNTIQILDTKKFKRYYEYALNGNLTRKDKVDPDTNITTDRWDYTYDNHQAGAIETTTHGVDRFLMQYDVVGNMTSQVDAEKNKSKQMVYTSDNRISRVTDPNNAGKVIGQYYYDDQGFRVFKVGKHDNENGIITNHAVFYPNKYISAEVQITDDGQEITDTYASTNHIYLNGVRIAALAHNGYANYYLTDQVDSVKVVTDNDGTGLTRFEYMPYGESWFTEGETKNAPKYNNQELDKETGYYYFNARHYDPEIARFVTADSIIDGIYETQGWNRYMYVKGNPVKYSDPTGNQSCGCGPTPSHQYQLDNYIDGFKNWANDVKKYGPVTAAIKKISDAVVKKLNKKTLTDPVDTTTNPVKTEKVEEEETSDDEETDETKEEGTDLNKKNDTNKKVLRYFMWVTLPT